MGPTKSTAVLLEELAEALGRVVAARTEEALAGVWPRVRAIESVLTETYDRAKLLETKVAALECLIESLYRPDLSPADEGREEGPLAE